MVQNGVPLYRDIQTEILRVNNVPWAVNEHDCRRLEGFLKTRFGTNTPLAVRIYKSEINQIKFLAFYLGKELKIQVASVLLREGIKLT